MHQAQMQYGCRKTASELILNGRHWQNEHVNIYCKLGVIKEKEMKYASSYTFPITVTK